MVFYNLFTNDIRFKLDTEVCVKKSLIEKSFEKFPDTNIVLSLAEPLYQLFMIKRRLMIQISLSVAIATPNAIHSRIIS